MSISKQRFFKKKLIGFWSLKPAIYIGVLYVPQLMQNY